MNKICTIALLATILFFGCKKDQLNTPDLSSQPDPLSTTEMNEHLRKSIETNGVFHWSTVDANFNWSAGMRSDSIFSIGYQPAGTTDLNSKIHSINIEDQTWKTVRTDILEMILEGEKENQAASTIEDLLPHGMPKVLPTMAVRITNKNTIEKLMEMSEIRYVEPMGYSIPSMSPNQVSVRSGSGCDGTPSYNLNTADYSTIAPNVKQSWNHNSSDVAGAWSTSTGDGVTICVIDSGASDDQENLGSAFNSGYSTGRTVTRLSTLYSGWWWWRSLQPPHDQCGHGTSMCGFATAPRGSDGNAVGVAYNSDLISIRAVEDVVINTSDEKSGVKNALIIAGNNAGVKVISMSIGTPFWSGTVADGIYFAHNKGKLIVAAAGTSLSWTSWWGVIFPANMSQTVAVTGVKDGEGSMAKCDECHSGSEVDFVMVMQRASNNTRNALTLTLDTNQPKYVGGSSAATASVAGIAALVWSNHPSSSRADIFNAMKWNSSFYPNESSNLGWGIIDAKDAVEENL
jgi:serine protease